MKVFRSIIAIALFSFLISGIVLLPQGFCAEEVNEYQVTPEEELPVPKPDTGDDGPMPLAAGTGETTDEPGSGLKVSLPEAMQFTGAATYSYPIEVPPGRANLAPKIVLTYNSQMRNGWLGVGWTLDMSAIQRSTKFGLDYADNNQPGAFVASINGSTAELVPRTDGMWNGYWSAKVEGAFSKYYFNSTGNYWIVTSKDGTKYYYGTTTYSRQTFTSGTFKWLLDRVEDVNGNFMTLTYYPVDNGEIYLSRIDYTGNVNSPTLPTTNSVTFGLDQGNRLDKPDMYTAHNRVQTRYRLSSINTYASGQPVRTYTIEYDESPDINRSLISSITPGNGTSTLPPASFTYHGTSGPFTQATWTSQTHYQTNAFNWVCDVDGDGKQDIVTWNNSSSIKINFGGNTGFTTQVWSGTFKQYNGKPMIWVGDFDGDGACDIATRENNTMLHIHLGNKQRGGFKFGTPQMRPAELDTYQKQWLGDFNGDGKADLMSWDNQANPDGSRVRMHITNPAGAGFDQATDWFTDFHKSATWGVMIWLGDFNGDGMTDVMAWDEDANPDGSKVIMHLSTGTNFSQSFWDASLPKNVWDQLYWAGDFNGDGMTDIISRDSASSCTMQFSTGSYFDRKYNWSCDLKIIVDYGPQFIFGDFDGDGRWDIISRMNSTQAKAHRYPIYTPADLMATAANGIGGTSTIAYAHSSERPGAQNLPLVVHTVDRITVNDGNGNDSITYYDYQEGFYAHGDREFYGFGYAKLTDPVGTTSETWFKQREATGVPNRYKGLPERQITKDSSGSIFANAVYTYTATTLPGDAVFPHLDYKDDYLCDGTTTNQEPCRKTRTELGYDSYGNVASKKIKQCLSSDVDCSTFADERYEFTLYTNNNQPCNQTKWIVNRPFTTYITDRNDTTIQAQTWFEYDNGSCARGNVTKKTLWLDTEPNPANYPTTQYQYNDPYFRLTKVIDPKGNSVTTVYETTTNTFPATETVDYLSGFTTSTTYNYRCSKPATKTDPNGAVTTNVYDGFCRPIKVIKSGDSETYPTQSYMYPLLTDYGFIGTQRITANLKAPSVANANHTLFKESYFDGLGRTIKTRKTGPPEESPIITEAYYNNRGLVDRKCLPYFEGDSTAGCTYFSYDPVGRAQTIVNPDGGQTDITYYQGRTETIDPLDHKKAKTTDIHGRLIQVEEYTGENPYTLYATTDYFYDTLGNLVEVQDGAKVGGQDRPNVTTMVYDSLSRKIRMTDPDMCHTQDPTLCYWEYRYDKNGNLTFQKDAKGQIIMFSYYNSAIGREDPLNRIMVKDYRVTEGDPVTQPTYETDVVYTYDTGTYGKGGLASVTDRSGSKTFTYDQRGRTTQNVTTIDSTQYTVSNTYDSADRVTSITYPNASVVAYGYDDGGNLYTVTLDGASRATYTYYNQIGKPTYVNYGNTKITTYAYETLTFRVHSIFTSGLQNLTYAYDRGGNVTSITDGINSSRTQTFTYDHLNRLSSATSTGYGTLDYAYNEIGNMTLNDRVGSYTYPQGIVGQPYGPAHPHAVSQAGGISYAYDNNGNLTSGNGRTISWHYDNKPRTITAAGSTVTYVYDYTGQRAKKTVGSTTTRYIGKLYECAGSTCTTYIFGGNQRIARKVGTQPAKYYHTDHLNSTAVMYDGTNPPEDYAYYPYGETLYASGSEKYRFTSQELDSEHGLYNYNAREYDPVLGRFISPDSIVQDFSDPQTLNRYSYCRNNPILYVDPSGHWFGIDDAIAAIVGAVVGGVSAAINGGNILQGAAIGAAAGWVGWNTGGLAFGGMDSVITSSLGYCSAGTTAAANFGAAVVGGAAGGVVAGGMGAAFNGGNIGQGMLTGAAYGAATGAVIGGIGSLYGYATAGSPAYGGADAGVSLQIDMGQSATLVSSGPSGDPVFLCESPLSSLRQVLGPLHHESAQYQLNDEWYQWGLHPAWKAKGFGMGVILPETRTPLFSCTFMQGVNATQLYANILASKAAGPIYFPRFSDCQYWARGMIHSATASWYDKLVNSIHIFKYDSFVRF